MSIRMSASERETTILYTQDPEDEGAQIVTADPHMIHRLARLGIVPEATQIEAGRVVSAEFIVPRSWIRVTPPRKASEGQRESAREAMIRLNERRTEAREQARNAPKKPHRRWTAHKEG